MYLNRWCKPRLYLTISGFSLPLALAFSFACFSLGMDGLPLLGGIFLLTAQGWLSILAIPTVVAAVKLLQARKLGVFISLALLPALGFAAGMSVYFVLGQTNIDTLDKVLIDLSIASVLVMLGPLVLGWKRMPWKSTRRASSRKGSAKTAARSNRI